MSTVGVPGHCWGLDGEQWHAPGECVALDCDHQCCVQTLILPPNVVAMRRLVIMDEVARLMEEHPEYKQVVFHREVEFGVEILTAVFLSAASTEVAQHIVGSLK